MAKNEGESVLALVNTVIDGNTVLCGLAFIQRHVKAKKLKVREVDTKARLTVIIPDDWRKRGLPACFENVKLEVIRE